MQKEIYATQKYTETKLIINYSLRYIYIYKMYVINNV